MNPFDMKPQTEHKKKKNKPEGFDSDLDRQCREFLARTIPVTNIVFVEEFNKYLALFNKELNERMDKDQLTKLSEEYYGRFSPQHPIYILTREPDPNGCAHPSDNAKYKVDKIIPPTFRRVCSLNDVGAQVPALIDALFNATIKTSGPFDRRKELYTSQIAKAIDMGEKKAGTADKQRQEFARMEAELLGTAKSKQDTSEDQGSSVGSDNVAIEW